MKRFGSYYLIFFISFFIFSLSSCSKNDEPQIPDNIPENPDSKPDDDDNIPDDNVPDTPEYILEIPGQYEVGSTIDFDGFTLIFNQGFIAVNKLPDQEDVIIPDFFRINEENVPVTEILDLAANNSVKTLHFPATLTKIGTLAFCEVNELETIYIEDLSAWCEIDFPAIDEKYNWNALPINMNATVIIEGKDVTGGTLVIPDNVVNINRNAFRDLNIAGLELGLNVEIIGESAFKGCGLKEVKFNDKLKEIGSDAFEYPSIVKLPSSVKEIGLPNFTLAKEIHIDSLEDWLDIVWIYKEYYDEPMAIPHDIIINGKILKNVVVPDEIKVLNNWAFANSTIESVEINNPDIELGTFYSENTSFFNCQNIESLTIPNELIVNLFSDRNYYLKNIKYLGISEGSKEFKYLQLNDFKNLISLTLPSTLEYCQIYFSGNLNDTSNQVFKTVNIYAENVPETVYKGKNIKILGSLTLNVPPGCKEKYAESDVWKNFGTINILE